MQKNRIDASTALTNLGKQPLSNELTEPEWKRTFWLIENIVSFENEEEIDLGFAIRAELSTY